MKKNGLPDLFPRGSRLKILIMMKMFIFLTFALTLSASASIYSQNQRVSFELEEASILDVLNEIKEQTGLRFIYNEDKIEELGAINFDASDMRVDEVLEEIFKDTNLECRFQDDVIMIVDRAPEPIKEQKQEKKVIKGKVTGEDGLPMVGVSVVIKGTYSGVSTNMDGIFSITANTDEKVILEFSFIGMQKKAVEFKGEEFLTIVLEEDVNQLGEVVTVGFFKQAKNSFTGVATVIKADEIKSVSNTSILAAISTFDPSFRIAESEFGSDPNRLPDINIRGKGSFYDPASLTDEFNPNRPTFVLDGFEVSFQTVRDLSIDRIETITLLKDAAATAIYGSRAANGVVVIDTKKDKSGKLRINYNYSLNVEAPDLRTYNLTNAAEKLEVERLAGLYESSQPGTYFEKQQLYNAKLYNVSRGVDTYWLGQPVRTGYGQRHTLGLSGGDKYLTYGFTLGYNDTQGVMKGSGRKQVSISSRLNYRWKNLTFSNNLRIQFLNSDQSPYGSFEQYTLLNPYYRLTDDNGNRLKAIGEDLVELYPGAKTFLNPVYEAEELNNKSFSKGHSISNDFNVKWEINEALKLNASIRYSLSVNESHDFKSPNSYVFNSKPFEERGEYSIGNSSRPSYSSNLVLQYFKQAEDHVFNGRFGLDVSHDESVSTGMRARGFSHDRLDFISWASQYAEGSPTATETINRRVGSFASLNYTYKARYLFDASTRFDGSSLFGKDQRVAPFWSVGLGWVIDKEDFLPKNIFSKLKLSASYGTTGGTAFSAYQALTRYKYNDFYNYNGLIGADISSLGNQDLKWETVYQKSVNLQMGFLNNKLTANVRYYSYLTKDALSPVSLAPSTGFTSFTSNIGEITNSGYEVDLNAILYKRNGLSISVFGRAYHNENVVSKISDGLKAYNETVLNRMNSDSNNELITNSAESSAASAILQYYEGKSSSSIYAVRSLGIDPSTGKEVFLNRFGQKTYEWDAYDQVEVGNSEPIISGSFGLTAQWKQFSVVGAFRYNYGAQATNATLLHNVENADIANNNVDKRVYDDRWRQPGDVATYKDIKNSKNTLMSSRFVQDNNTIEFSSLNCSYRFKKEQAEKLGLSSLKFGFNMNDIFYLSSVKKERGTQYPFANKFSFNMQVGF